MTEEHETGDESGVDDATVVARREAGASWQELAAEFGLSRQQVRYRYQRGKRQERRRARRERPS